MNSTNIEKYKKLEKLVKELLSNSGTTHGLARSLRNIQKELELFDNHVSNTSGQEKLRKLTNKTNKVQVGGGNHTLNGFINIDIVPPADIICDVREGIPLEDSTVNFVFSEHFLEHIDYPISVKKFIKDCFRILKDDGELVMGVPDAKLATKSYLNEDENYWEKALSKWYKNRNNLNHFNTHIDLLNYVFRDQDDDPKYNPHYWAYDFEKLESLLREAKFKKVKLWNFDKSIANPKREWGSLYVEATK